MTLDIGELTVFLVVAAAAGSVGVAFGIFFLAPRLSRHAEHDDEEPCAGHD